MQRAVCRIMASLPTKHSSCPLRGHLSVFLETPPSPLLRIHSRRSSSNHLKAYLSSRRLTIYFLSLLHFFLLRLYNASIQHTFGITSILPVLQLANTSLLYVNNPNKPDCVVGMINVSPEPRHDVLVEGL